MDRCNIIFFQRNRMCMNIYENLANKSNDCLIRYTNHCNLLKQMYFSEYLLEFFFIFTQ